MTRNIGSMDRNVRIVVGLAILAIGMFLGSWWGLVGLIPLGTAMIGWCPLYAPFKITTVRRQAV